MPGPPTKRRAAFKLSDIVASILSLALAGACIYFAGSKIYRLREMENPPADLGLRYRPSAKKPRRTTAPQAVLVDPLTTGTIDAEATEFVEPFEPAQPYRAESPVLQYRLLAVIDGIAFVEVTTVTGKDILPLGAGSLLPGAGPIERIEKADGRWRITAGGLRVEAEAQ